MNQEKSKINMQESIFVQEIKERFVAFKKNTGLTDLDLSSTLGTSTASISDFLKKSTTIGKVVQNTILQFPDLNCNWLFRGDGSMLISNDVRTHTHEGAPSSDLVNYLIEVNSALHERIIQLERENAILSNSANKKS